MERIARKRLVPAVTLHTEEHALPVADALLAGGLDIMEITFRTAAAAGALRRLARERPDLLLGAGTILTREQLDAAIDAGVTFVVSPGLDEALVAHATERGIVFVPGVMTPTEVQRALSIGCKTVKVFPAGVLGGPAGLKSMLAPFLHAGVQAIPMGGVRPANLKDYLAVPGVTAVGGSWFTEGALLRDRDWAGISRLAADALATVRGLGDA